MSSDDRKPDSNTLATAEACGHLNVVVHKLRAAEAAARGTDMSAQAEGIAWVLADVWREVEDIRELVGGVNARLRQNGDGSEPEEADPFLTSDDRLFDVLGVCQHAICLAADGELENSYDVSPRKVFRAVYDFIDPAYHDAVKARGIDEDEEIDRSANTLRSLAEGVKEERS